MSCILPKRIIIKHNKLKVTPKGHVVVKGDKNRITQVLSNLVNNAIKFTTKGSIAVTMGKK